MERDTVGRSQLISEKIQLIHDVYRYNYYGRIIAGKLFMDTVSPELKHRLTTPYDEQLFLEHPSSFAFRNGGFHMAEHLAINFKSVNLGNALVNGGSSVSGLDPIANNIQRLTPAQCGTCIKDSFKQIQALVDGGADVNSSTSSGVTTLMIAAALDVSVCRLLIDKGADVNAQTERGQTALHFALAAIDEAQRVEAVQLLLEKGADPSRCDDNGDDSLRTACCCGFEETLVKLIDTLYAGNEEAMNRQLMNKYCRLALICNVRKIIINNELKSNDDAPVQFNSRPLPEEEQENLKRYLDEALELTREIFGSAHRRFYEALHETAWCYFKASFFDKWLSQLTHNIQVFRSSDLDADRRCEELDRLTVDARQGVLYVSLIQTACLRNPNEPRDFASFGFVAPSFDVVYELVNAVIQEASNCTQPNEAKRLGHLLSFFIRLIFFVECKQEQMDSFRGLVRRAVALGLRTPTAKEPLMASILEYQWAVVNTSDVIAMLLECGADVEERDEHGSNIVHLLAKWRHNAPVPGDAAAVVRDEARDEFELRFLTWQRDDADTAGKIARTCVKHGIHLDAKNHEGLDTWSCLKYFGIDIKEPLSLECLAAQAIRRYNVRFEGKIPADLVDFVKMH